MTKHNGILIKNIYYMLSYAYQVLKQKNYQELASEDFENVQDLLAGILAVGMAQQVKQGLYREYVPHTDDIAGLRGRIKIHDTIHKKIKRHARLAREYDQLTENNIFNQIIKTTAFHLLKSNTVNKSRRHALKKVLLFFADVDNLDPAFIDWNTLRFHRNNQNYIMLLNICSFVLDSLLLTTEKGLYKMSEFSLDEINLAKLFEKFVLEYYRYHHPMLKASSTQIKWDVDTEYASILPTMYTDVTLRYGDEMLIIDTKYYNRTMQTHWLFGTQTLHSSNLYQIFSYVKNADSDKTGNVSGLLLYAKTGESISTNCDVIIDGNRISVRILDLNVPFPEIAAQLDDIATSFFETYSISTTER